MYQSVTSTGEFEDIEYSLPTGIVMMWQSFASIPEGWLECNGQEIPSEYTDLLEFMAPSTTTPDFRGRVLIQHNPSNSNCTPIGKEGGSTSVSLTYSHLPDHTHPLKSYDRDQHSWQMYHENSKYRAAGEDGYVLTSKYLNAQAVEGSSYQLPGTSIKNNEKARLDLYDIQKSTYTHETLGRTRFEPNEKPSFPIVQPTKFIKYIVKT